MNRFLQLGANKNGRDFVIGDIHGKYDLLMRGLDSVNFCPTVDRLIAVGDLVDRGKQNMEVLRLIGEPGFYTVIGNHEILMADGLAEDGINTVYGGRTAFKQWYFSGGHWYDKLWDYEKEELLETFVPLIHDELPIAIEFIAENGQRVGVTHGGLPRAWTWDQTRKHLECCTGIDHVAQEIIWTRTRIQSTAPQADILGVDLLVNGHTPSKKEVWRGNNVFIDLGTHNKYQLVPINVMDLFDRIDTEDAERCIPA